MLMKEENLNVGGVERAARVLAGVWLIGKAVSKARWNPLAYLQGALGGELLWTGVSGYSPLNAMLGRDSHPHALKA